MRNELHNIATIERYLLGEMPADEQALFEKEMRENPELAESVDLQRKTMDGLKRSHLQQQIRSAKSSYHIRKQIKSAAIATTVIALTATMIYLAWSSKKNTESAAPEQSLTLPQFNETGDTLWADADRYLPYQLFEIDAQKDTVLESEDGVVMAIAANTFTDENGKAVQGKITFEFKEALHPEDIISGGLSTMSNGELLETAGMFYINARQNNQSLKIAKGKEILVEVPTNEISPDMQLFEGQRMPDGQINWIKPEPLRKKLVAIDMTELNFYPPHFRDSLLHMGKAGNKKSYTDSLYYSFCFVSENITQNSNSHTEHIAVPMGTDTTYGSFTKSQVTSDSVISYSIGIDPCRVKAFWNPAFNETFLATREFEERMPAIHRSCNNAVLEVYLNNLDKNLCTVDSMAAKIAGEPFNTFAKRGDGKVEGKSNAQLKQLQNHYAKMLELERSAIAKTKTDYYQKNEAKRKAFYNAKMQNFNENLNRENNVFQQEYRLNLCNAYQQIGKDCPPEVNLNRRGRRYQTAIATPGWKNLDQYVSEATLKRQDMLYTDPTTGKTATLNYDPIEISIAERLQFSKVFVYLLPAELNSFQRIKEINGTFKEQLNMSFKNRVCVLAYKNEKKYFLSLGFVQATSYLNQVLKQTDEETLQKEMRGICNSGQQKDLNSEINFLALEIKEEKRQAKLLQESLFRQRIQRVIFPCSVTDTVQIVIGKLE
jgi:hypothetical protein